MKHWALLVIILILLAIRLASPSHDNPPVTAAIDAPAEVVAVFERSCYDCHSNLTEWPWYSHLPPASWVVGNHVVRGREHLNFSTWGTLGEGNRKHLAMEIVEEIESGEMPLSGYIRLHSDAALSPDDVDVLHGWARSLGVVSLDRGEEH